MPFRFKQFSVEDDRSTMKVGTDAVLLGAWVNVAGAKNILDIGTGCGVIALMLAQRCNGPVDAVEADKGSAEQAKENFKNSPWHERLNLYTAKIQEYEHTGYDLIVSNPPYFSNSLLPPGLERKNARHTQTLSFEELLSATKRLLKNDGRFAVVLPVTEGNYFRSLAPAYGLHCTRSLSFFTRKGKPQERWLFEFSQEQKIPAEGEMVLYDGGQWSEQYRKLTDAFYLGTF